MNTLPLQKVTGLTLYKSKEIPRYLYTITTKENYASMCKDGFIKTKQDPLCRNMRGVFLFDIVNLTKRWSKNFLFKTSDMASALFASLTMKSEDLVVLKIPTKKLDGQLRIRDLNHLFRCYDVPMNDPHINIGLDARLRKNLSQHRKSIEYIYKNDIPIDNVEKIGEVHVDKMALGRGKLKIKEILSRLFAGTPQHKTIEQMK